MLPFVESPRDPRSEELEVTCEERLGRDEAWIHRRMESGMRENEILINFGEFLVFN